MLGIRTTNKLLVSNVALVELLESGNRTVPEVTLAAAVPRHLVKAAKAGHWLPSSE